MFVVLIHLVQALLIHLVCETGLIEDVQLCLKLGGIEQLNQRVGAK